jgi:hypothetical protein
VSKIDEQIKALQTKKRKIDCVIHIASKLKEITSDYADVASEVVAQLENYTLKLAEGIENDSDLDPKSVTEKLSDSHIVVLRALAERAMNKIPVQAPEPKADQVPQNNVELSVGEKMDFAMKHQHLGGKFITVEQNGNTFRGVVIGLTAPNIILKTEAGVELTTHIRNLRG